MALNIKNDEAHGLAVQVAGLTGESLTAAVVQALRERLQRLERDVDPANLAAQMRAIGRDCASRIPKPLRSVDHGDMLYGPDGLPK